MNATLEAVKRDDRGKNAARRMRAAGRIPAVVYGAQAEGRAPEGVSVSVDPKEVLRILRSESGVNTLIGLSLDGRESKVMVRDYQVDPVSHRLLHADFYQLRMDRKMTVTVPVVLRGESQGVKLQGGMMDFVNREIEVECLPTDIPEHIDIDVSALMLNEGVRVRDLPASPTWTPLTDAATLLVHIVMPKAEESKAAGDEAAASAEPEVAAKGKEASGEGKGDEKK
jgi:large subunit ribosomal protein L25